MTSTPAVLAAAAGVGFGHAVLPDHWAPLAVMARARRQPVRRTVRLAAMAGITHVALSLVLGGALIAVGLHFQATVQRHADLIVGGLLLATGAVFLVQELLGHGHGHDHDVADHHDQHDHGSLVVQTRPAAVHAHPDPARDRTARLGAFIVSFGAAASPDLTVLPVFLAASALGLAASLGTLLVFGLVTLTTIVGLTTLAAVGGHRVRGAWIDKSANLITALVLLAIGALVATGAI
jgi:nickel/cobalt exporter